VIRVIQGWVARGLRLGHDVPTKAFVGILKHFRALLGEALDFEIYPYAFSHG
jgi:hypothetical protein